MIDVLVITKNEECNLPHCLHALAGWTRAIYVVDSGSTDRTIEIARELGAEVAEQREVFYRGIRGGARGAEMDPESSKYQEKHYVYRGNYSKRIDFQDNDD